MGQAASARPEKSAAAFRTIGEVASDLDLPPHVLRFWESKFPQLRPLKRGGGRRYYRPEDIVVLRRIRQCLYQDGYTIRGVQRLLGDATGNSAGPGGPAMPSLLPLEAAPEPSDRVSTPRRRPAKPSARDPNTRGALEELRRELLDIRLLVDELLRRPKPS